MQEDDATPTIHPEDIRSRSIERRTFLGRFGALASLSGLLGYTVGCENGDPCDTDMADEIQYDSDGTDDPHVDSDYADPCNTEKG